MTSVAGRRSRWSRGRRGPRAAAGDHGDCNQGRAARSRHSHRRSPETEAVPMPELRELKCPAVRRADLALSFAGNQARASRRNAPTGESPGRQSVTRAQQSSVIGLQEPSGCIGGQQRPGADQALPEACRTRARSAVASSAGKKHSIRKSWSVTFCGVPSVVTVEKRTPARPCGSRRPAEASSAAPRPYFARSTDSSTSMAARHAGSLGP